MVQEMLDSCIIQPIQSTFFAPMVMVHKKQGTWCMCLDYREINKMNIKYKVCIPIIDKLLYVLHATNSFTKLYIHYGYHQSKMRK